MARATVTVQQAADQLGVHYMTAYRYVRTGQLEARREHSTWLVDARSVQELARRRASATTKRGNPLGSTRRDALLRCIVNGDEQAAWQHSQDLLQAGMEPEELYLAAYGPAMEAVGAAWARGELTVGDEHKASTVMIRLTARLGPRFSRRGRTRGTIVLATPPGDRHSLPVTLLADPLRGRRFEVVDLGADVPPASLADAAAAADRLVGVGICATTAGHRSIRAAVRAVHERLPDAAVVLGGLAVPDAETARRLGADRFTSSAAEAIDAFDGLRA